MGQLNENRVCVCGGGLVIHFQLSYEICNHFADF